MKTKTCSPRPSAVRLVGFIIGMACIALADGELDSAVLHGETDKERAIDYQPGETMTFTAEPPPDLVYAG